MAGVPPRVTLAFSTAGLLVGLGGFAHSLYKAHQETLSKASRLNLDYGDTYRQKMSFFTNYKTGYEKKGVKYADAFAKHAQPDDREAEKCRGSLAGFWDNVVEDHRMGLLPKNFFAADSGKWLQRAKNYRALVEPIDIANYKRLGFEKDSGGYWEHNNRPSQYVYIEKLEQAADGTAAKG